ncbi:MAG: hypothetical protein J3K34DRAFT_481550 [Monoraphidium minutum]|nr:MAG: hypothetical protein J3K34DRAFT_481550 [Monoraphidium minutum]
MSAHGSFGRITSASTISPFYNRMAGLEGRMPPFIRAKALDAGLTAQAPPAPAAAGACGDNAGDGPEGSSGGPVLAEGFVLAGQYEIQARLAQGGFGTVYRALDLLHPLRPAVAIKLELVYTLPAPGPGPAAATAAAAAVKRALRDARLRREWAVYSRLGAVGPPGAETPARRHGVPVVHAWGHAVLEGRAAPPAPAPAALAPAPAPAPAPPAPAPPAPSPAALHHCMWMAMELLGEDLWAARDRGAAFRGGGGRGAAELAAAGKAALQARGWAAAQEAKRAAAHRPSPKAPAAGSGGAVAPGAAQGPGVFVVDMGLAAFMEGGVGGSVNMLRLGRASPLDDLFSLGSALLELQAGHLPWSGLMDSAPTARVGGSGGGGGGGGDAATVCIGTSGGEGDAEGGAGGRAADSGEFGRRRLAAAAAARERAWALAVRQGRLPPWALAWHLYLSALQPGDAVSYAHLAAILGAVAVPPAARLRLRPRESGGAGAGAAAPPAAAAAAAAAAGGPASPGLGATAAVRAAVVVAGAGKAGGGGGGGGGGTGIRRVRGFGEGEGAAAAAAKRFKAAGGEGVAMQSEE